MKPLSTAISANVTIRNSGLPLSVPAVMAWTATITATGYER